MTRTITINGAAIYDIASFYAEINRVFMEDEDWRLGESLDAFSDMLRGGYGAIGGDAPVRLVWSHMDRSRAALGLETTRDWLERKLQQPDIFNVEAIRRQIADLISGKGQTYFDILVEIIREQPNIELVAA